MPYIRLFALLLPGWLSFGFVVTTGGPPAYAHPHPELDTDNDGLSDALERETGTSPLLRDTDGDGVDDGIEDKNRDGRVDPGETNPRRAGLFPGSAPHIPEPLVFDMIRGLGAQRGELEVNTLVVVDAKRGTVLWAPEVEWAFADGYAIELELPMLDRELEAVKLALQGTLPSPWESLAHGWQTFAEVGLDAGDTDAVALYILGQRFSRRWSYLAMLGANTQIRERSVADVEAIGNASLFFDVREWQTWGIETNTTMTPSGERIVRAYPQMHLQLSERFRIQLSAGAEFHKDAIHPAFAMRAIIE